MRNQTMSRDDIHATYVETYLGYRNDRGIIQPMYVIGSTEVDGQWGLHVELVDSGNTRALALDDDRIVYDHPDSGIYRAGRTIVYIKRVAQRQWRKGIRTRALSIIKLSNLSGYEDYRTAITGMYHPEYTPLTTALAGKVSYAVHQRFAIVKSDRYTNRVIYMDDQVVGEVKDGAPVFTDKSIERIFLEVTV